MVRFGGHRSKTFTILNKSTHVTSSSPHDRMSPIKELLLKVYFDDTMAQSDDPFLYSSAIPRFFMRAAVHSIYSRII